uniref:Serine threonine-protein kinase edr1-like isoform x1 n=1 Tax=Tetraselmis sp. GSL018 TaxID=582737 RepID=A0A061R0Y7_9CHLO
MVGEFEDEFCTSIEESAGPRSNCTVLDLVPGSVVVYSRVTFETINSEFATAVDDLEAIEEFIRNLMANATALFGMAFLSKHGEPANATIVDISYADNPFRGCQTIGDMIYCDPESVEFVFRLTFDTGVLPLDAAELANVEESWIQTIEAEFDAVKLQDEIQVFEDANRNEVSIFATAIAGTQESAERLQGLVNGEGVAPICDALRPQIDGLQACEASEQTGESTPSPADSGLPQTTIIIISAASAGMVLALSVMVIIVVLRYRHLSKIAAKESERERLIKQDVASSLFFSNEGVHSGGVNPLIYALSNISDQSELVSMAARSDPATFSCLAACAIAIFIMRARRMLMMLSLAGMHAGTPAHSMGVVFGRGPNLGRKRDKRVKDPSLNRALKAADRLEDFRSQAQISMRDAGVVDLDVNFDEEIKDFIKGRIGAGAFGQVFLARWRGQDVAVKMFIDEYRHDEAGNLSNFRAELQMMAEHVAQGCDRIVKLLGACLTPPNICIIYEYVPNGSLHDRIHSGEPLSYLDVISLSRDIAEGLAFLHPSVVHRDLKPQNILLDSQWHAKICDLGLSRHKDALQSYLRTEAGGTPIYMAPEIFVRAQVHTRADIYSLGVIMNQMISCEVPWKGMLPFQVIYAVSMKHERPPIPSECPEAFRNIIERCWDSNVDNRPRASELVRWLDDLYADVSVEMGVQGKL